MRTAYLILIPAILIFVSCGNAQPPAVSGNLSSAAGNSAQVAKRAPRNIDITLQKQFLYDQHTLEDTYPSGDTTRRFQWDKIREGIKRVETAQSDNRRWVYFRNKANVNGISPVVERAEKNDFRRLSDPYGVEQYQSVPLYEPGSMDAPLRYGQDGLLAEYRGTEGDYYRVSPLDFGGEWLVPVKYCDVIDSVEFTKIIFVDRANQNISTVEKGNDQGLWLVRSMNPATTGLHNPPYQYETPLGIFVLQEKKQKMVYLHDGSDRVGGFAPWANRFSGGGYIHGVPVNAPNTALVEFSSTLGTTPRSHKCVRNATSHAKFIYDWAPVEKSIIYVIE